MGAPLARLEAQIALPVPLSALVPFGLEDDAVTYKPTETLRATSQMWLTR